MIPKKVGLEKTQSGGLFNYRDLIKHIRQTRIGPKNILASLPFALNICLVVGKVRPCFIPDESLSSQNLQDLFAPFRGQLGLIVSSLKTEEEFKDITFCSDENAARLIETCDIYQKGLFLNYLCAEDMKKHAITEIDVIKTIKPIQLKTALRRGSLLRYSAEILIKHKGQKVWHSLWQQACAKPRIRKFLAQKEQIQKFLDQQSLPYEVDFEILDHNTQQII